MTSSSSPRSSQAGDDSLSEAPSLGDTASEYSIRPPGQRSVDEWTQPGERTVLCQAKTVLLGDVAAGKTSFLNAMRLGKSKLAPGGVQGRTIGIEVHAVQLAPDVRLWFYDFGGHETYRFSQQLFLSNLALYLITVDIGKYDPDQFAGCLQYWYTVLTSRLIAPRICVLATHTDYCQPHDVIKRCDHIKQVLKQLEAKQLLHLQRHLDKVEAAQRKSQAGEADPARDFQVKSLKHPMDRVNLLLNNRPRICSRVLCVSSKTMEGFTEVKEILLSVIRSHQDSFPHASTPASWLKLGDALADVRRDRPFLHWSDFEEMAGDQGIHGPECRPALDYLQKAGVVLHYEDYKKDSELKKYVFNNTNLLLSIFSLIFNHNYYLDEVRYIWFNKGMLKLPRLDLDALRRNVRSDGLIGEKLLKCFWNTLGLGDEVFQAMLSLLGKFDLCYEVPRLEGKYLPDGRHFKFPYLVPEKMPEQAMYIWTESVPENFEEHQLMLSLEAPTIPQSFMEKISIRINPFLDLRADWKWGTVAFCNEGQDVIKIEIVQQDDTTSVVILARVRHSRRHMARHILLLLVAVINKILLRQFPGVLGYWYVVCAHCVKLTEDDPQTMLDLFPADNLVFASNTDFPVACRNCKPGETLDPKDVFPVASEDLVKGDKMSAAEKKALKAVLPRLVSGVEVSQLLTPMLRRGVLTLREADDVTNQKDSRQRMTRLVQFLVKKGSRGFQALSQTLRMDVKEAELALEIDSIAGYDVSQQIDTDPQDGHKVIISQSHVGTGVHALTTGDTTQKKHQDSTQNEQINKHKNCPRQTDDMETKPEEVIDGKKQKKKKLDKQSKRNSNMDQDASETKQQISHVGEREIPHNELIMTYNDRDTKISTNIDRVDGESLGQLDVNHNSSELQNYEGFRVFCVVGIPRSSIMDDSDSCPSNSTDSLVTVKSR